MRAMLRLLALGAACCAALPTSNAVGKPVRTAATCSHWNVTGTWTTLQSNRYRVTWRLTQSGTTVSGTAVLPQGDAARGGYTGTVGRVIRGSLVGSRLDLVVQWPPRTDGSLTR